MFCLLSTLIIRLRKPLGSRDWWVAAMYVQWQIFQEKYVPTFWWGEQITMGRHHKVGVWVSCSWYGVGVGLLKSLPYDHIEVTVEYFLCTLIFILCVWVFWLHMSVHNTCAWCLWRPEKGAGSLVEYQTVVRSHVGAGNQVWVLCESTWGSSPLSHLLQP